MSDERPRFDTLYKEPWQFHRCDGVGVKFKGVPKDIGALARVFEGHECPPDLARRAVLDLYAKGERVTTIMAHIDFDRLARECAPLGVSLEIVPPRWNRVRHL